MKFKPGTTYQIGLVQAQAYRRLQNHYRLALEPYGVSIPEWSLLGSLFDAGPMTPSELAKVLKSKASHPSVLISNLEETGLVTRNSAGTDKRSSQISLTEKGKALIPEVEKTTRRALREDLKDLSPADLLLYYHLLEKIAKGLEEDSSTN